MDDHASGSDECAKGAALIRARDAAVRAEVVELAAMIVEKWIFVEPSGDRDELDWIAENIRTLAKPKEPPHA